MSTPTHLLFCDLETTTTNPTDPHAAILEVGAIITRWQPDLPEVARASLVIRPPGLQADHDMMWSRMDPYVQQMHAGSGLWTEATTGEDAWNLSEADRAISDWIGQHVDGPLPLAGSGVAHLDAPFVKTFLPHVAARLTYWMLDIGQIRRMLDLAGRSDHVDMVTDVDAKPHRGLADVELHVAEARRYLQVLDALPRHAEPAPTT